MDAVRQRSSSRPYWRLRHVCNGLGLAANERHKRKMLVLLLLLTLDPIVFFLTLFARRNTRWKTVIIKVYNTDICVASTVPLAGYTWNVYKLTWHLEGNGNRLAGQGKQRWLRLATIKQSAHAAAHVLFLFLHLHLLPLEVSRLLACKCGYWS